MTAAPPCITASCAYTQLSWRSCGSEASATSRWCGVATGGRLRMLSQSCRAWRARQPGDVVFQRGGRCSSARVRRSPCSFNAAWSLRCAAVNRGRPRCSTSMVPPNRGNLECLRRRSCKLLLRSRQAQWRRRRRWWVRAGQQHPRQLAPDSWHSRRQSEVWALGCVWCSMHWLAKGKKTTYTMGTIASDVESMTFAHRRPSSCHLRYFPVVAH